MDSAYSAQRRQVSDLLASLGGSGKSPKTYASLAASKTPGSVAGQVGREQRPSAFFNPRDSPSPDLLAKVASLIKKQAPPLGRTDRTRSSTQLASERGTPEDLFSGAAKAQRTTSSPGATFLRPASVTPQERALGQGLRVKRSATTPEVACGLGVLPGAAPAQPRSGGAVGAAAAPMASSRWGSVEGQRPEAPPSMAAPAAAADEGGGAAAAPAWSEELLNWMLAEKAELLLEVQRAQRRQQEMQQELDRARAGCELEEEVMRLKVERRMLLERLQRLAQQDADSAALLDRIRMENDALTNELERSQEVCKEMLAARRAARDALSEMSAQNARLVSAYVEKKAEAAQLKEDLRRQQCEAEARIRGLEADLNTAQAQCLELRSRLQHSSHLHGSPDLAHLSSPLHPSHATGLPGLSPMHKASSASRSVGTLSDAELGSPFSTPARNRTPPSSVLQQQQQQQGGKENASWSGNRSGTSTARRKPPLASGSAMGFGEAPPPPEQAGSNAPEDGRGGNWDKERSDLLSLLERLQHQLSAHAEAQQAAATPMRERAQGPRKRASAAPVQQAEAAKVGGAEGEGEAQAREGPSPGPAAVPLPGLHPPGLQSPGMQPSLSPALGGRLTPSPQHGATEEGSPAMTPPSHSHCSTHASTGTKTRHSHFSVPRHTSSQPPSRAQLHAPYSSRGGSSWGESSGGSHCSEQTAARTCRRTSGVNLSKAFEGACSQASTRSDKSEACCQNTAAGWGWAQGSPCPDGTGGAQPPSPSSSASQAASEACTPPSLPSSPRRYQETQQATPVILPTATPFPAKPLEEAACPSAPADMQQQGGHGFQQAQAAALGAEAVLGADAAAGEQQRLAEAERRNAVLEAEVQQLQQEADERLRQDELRRQIDQHKQAGNAAFQQQRYEEAVREYTAGLELAGPASPSASAVLFCNRAAALHVMGRYLDAVADCFRAEDKDPSYARLYHRRADAYCAVGAYDAASQDLARLVEMGCGREVAARLADVQNKLRAAQPVNHYAVLGVKSSATPAEVKAAYRSLALRFHPDKAGQLDLPHAAADAVFKLVTAAHAALSDAEKRRSHDLQCLRHKYRRFYSYHF